MKRFTYMRPEVGRQPHTTRVEETEHTLECAVSEFQRNGARLVDGCQRGTVYVISRYGGHVAVLISAKAYNSLLRRADEGPDEAPAPTEVEQS